jgi:phospholipid/cholesterol/gamma-HCH transport system substrate-binding protein
MAKGKWTRELWVGFLGILALLVLYVLINFFKGINLVEDTNTYYVKFDNVEGIVNASPVYINGYKVGNVQDIIYDFDGGEGVIVELSLDDRLKIPADSYAEVNTSMLGSSTVNIVAGTGDRYLSPGDTITGRLNGSAMDEAAKMIPAIAGILPKVDSVLVSLNNVLSNPAINNSMNNVEQLTARLNSTAAEIDKLLKGDITTATGKLVALEDEMLELSSKLNEIEYREIVASLETSLKNIEEITAALNNGEGTAGMLLKDTTLYTRLNNTCEAATLLLEDMKKNPKRYVHFSVFGRKEKKE